MNKFNYGISLIVSLAFGIMIGYIALPQINTGERELAANTSPQSAKPQPLYWVAPMDPNYKRDKPGKSPMGMDLVPVYGDGQGQDSAGTIQISPEVVNNLGVRTAKVERVKRASKIKTVGYVGYDEDKLVHIHPRVQGWVEKLYVTAAGDPVKQGQPLYTIYSPALVNAQEEMLLALKRNNQRLIQAATDRLKALNLSPQAIASLKSSRQVKQQVTFYSPQEGVVENLYIREGFYVKPGTMIMSIGALDEVWVEAEVFERQAAAVRLDAPVNMNLDYLPGRVWHGKVDYIHPALDASTRTLKVRLRFANQDRLLKPNMFAQVEILSSDLEPFLYIPSEAVIRTGERDRVVLALGQGRFKSVEIAVGHYKDGWAQVVSGLKKGDIVVSSAQFLLDSESSKTSDFKRMHFTPDIQIEQTSKPVQSAVVDGIVNKIDKVKDMVNISRDQITKWQRPPASMDFKLADELNFDELKPSDELKPGQAYRFKFIIEDGEFIIVELLASLSAARAAELKALFSEADK